MSKTNISESDKRLLWLRAAGRCEFEGCNKILYEGNITNEYGNFGELCHIIGDSPNGPRGGERSKELAKDIDNIVLMCPTCHKMIDSDPKKYTTEIVKGMKKRHEDRIRLVTGIAHDKKSHVVTYYSKIGKHLPDFSFNTISSVLFPDYFPEASIPIEISMRGNVMKESDPNFWGQSEKPVAILALVFSTMHTIWTV